MENVQVVETLEPSGEATGRPRTRRLGRILRDLIPTTVMAASVAAAVSVVVAGSTRELHAPFADTAGDAPGFTRTPATQPSEGSVSVWSAPRPPKPQSSEPGFDLELLGPLPPAAHPPGGPRELIFRPIRGAAAGVARVARTIALPVSGSIPIEAETVLPTPPAVDVSLPATGPETVPVPLTTTQEAQSLQRPRKLKDTRATPKVSGTSVQIASADSRPYRPKKTTSGSAAAENPQTQGKVNDQGKAAGHDEAAGANEATPKDHEKGHDKGNDKDQASGHRRPPRADK